MRSPLAPAGAGRKHVPARHLTARLVRLCVYGKTLYGSGGFSGPGATFGRFPLFMPGAPGLALYAPLDFPSVALALAERHGASLPSAAGPIMGGSRGPGKVADKICARFGADRSEKSFARCLRSH